METQVHINMGHGEIQEERSKEPMEEMREEEKEFLKDLYIFMKKRDTPIERIPNLGFKQIDLFVMYRTVRDLGGYHQVTAQQLWKQVYNMLGGNPRSTSAATCTRRHYEKLLLPYECHVKGISMNSLPLHQPKHFPFANFNKDSDDGQRPAKRKMLSIPLHQGPHPPQPDRHVSAFPLQLQYPSYFHPTHAVLAPHIPITTTVLTPQTTPVPEYSFNPYRLNIESVKEPLEHLRYLAEQYKTSSGFEEPMDLRVKASRQETNSSPASSFAPPLPSKNPKFLNKPSPLYTPQFPQVVKNNRCETQDCEVVGETPSVQPGKPKEAYVIEVKAITASGSPTYDSTLTVRADEGARNPTSPKTDFTVQQKDEREGSPEIRRLREGSPEVRRLNLSHILPSLPRENGGEMEIEIPLSVFQNWLRLYKSSATMQGDKQLPTTPPSLQDQSVQRNCPNTDPLSTSLTFQMNPQHWSSLAQDLRSRQRNLPSPTPTTQMPGSHHSASQNPFTSYKPLPPSGILKNAASHDVHPFDHQDVLKLYTSKSTNCWNACDKEARVSPIQGKIDSNPLTVLQNFATSKSYNEDSIQGGKERSEMVPSAVLMTNNSSTPLLHLTPEEVMKLKRIISSST